MQNSGYQTNQDSHQSNSSNFQGQSDQIQTHQQTIALLHSIAHIMQVKLDKEEIAILLELCDRGLSVEALVSVVKELKERA